MNSRLVQLARWIAMDFHIQQTLLLRGWQTIAGVVTLIAVAHWMTAVEQGFYYTFASLIALQVFFELGLNYVVMQIVSHESAHLRVASTGEVVGDPAQIDRIAALVALLRQWYRVAASLFLIGVGTFGLIFFSKKSGLAGEEWLPIWCTLVAVVAGNFYLSPMIAVIEGCGQVGQIARVRLIQAIIGSLSAWLLLYLGAGLAVVAVLPTVELFFSVWWLKRRSLLMRTFQTGTQKPSFHRIIWKKEIFPLQWRIAVSWTSGYFIFQLFPPLVFAHQGAIEAGRIGMAMSIFGTLTNIGMSWVNAKLPQLGAHIAKGERKALNQLFFQNAKRSISFIATSSTAVIVFFLLLDHLNFAIIERISSLPILMCLAVTAIANSFIFSGASYMRAHCEEPLLTASICMALLSLLAVYFGTRVSVFLPVLLWTGVTVFVGVPWTIWLFIKYFRRSL